MFETTITGPCGYSLSQIIATADSFGAQAATFGVSDPEQVHRLLAVIGDRLVAIFSQPEYSACLPTYRHYVTRAQAEILDGYDIVEVLLACVDLDLGGDGCAPSENVRFDEATSVLLGALYKLTDFLNISPSESLEVLAWIQFVLGIRIACADDLSLAAMAGLTQEVDTDAA